MNNNSSIISLKFYGISPWEMEVLYGLLSNKFEVNQEETEQTNTDFVSGLIISIPVQFSEEFFKWFEFRAWEKVKAILKEMKRRRGRGNDIKIEIIFTGNPNVLPYHLNQPNIPKNLSEIIYKFDTETSKWRLNVTVSENKRFIFTKKGWQATT
ncbi:hypothetical protein AAA799D07_00507 [Marine Group I thaumarchaeote SCGC AAA799-D07]|nr:hypothetical protein AAA799D07_00507 [Marine Group I thaumarchaeote SCGC AAA799-D07]